ncbi:aminotransferase class IV [Kitasatospora sp. NA04385]|uniref:aminotransferase class IV n=1 Tax=Kitasatospora sp. NA04385 TaxID=2742135 RepID=UPI001591E236|nr:aminotransferase class IV [Kitasatospora sp. NA04385]QKW23806.1 aminotransferase class IV [Kitasatospora sp. NA04385]
MLNVEINGRPANVEDVHRMATWNYGHFTSMQVRDGAVRGLDLHLRRLADASRELFADLLGAQAPGDELVRGLVRQALGGRPDASVRVSVVPAGPTGGTDLVVSVSDPVPDVPRPALRVRTAVYERDLPHLKHAATMGLTHQALSARRAGFEDVLFLGRDGSVREGSVWNAAFWDGERVIWPAAPALPGITMHLLRAALPATGVPSTTRHLAATDLPSLRAAAATNSHCPAQPLASVDHVTFPNLSAELAEILTTAWSRVPWEAL